MRDIKMYPQQQHHVPFTNLQQQPYYSAANPFLFSSPLISDSALHPPGTDPHANSIPSSAVYGPQMINSQNWVVKQAQPIRYDHVVGSLDETSAASAIVPSTWNGTWPHQLFTNDTTVTLPNKTKVSIPMRCETCKIDCNSKDVYEKHILGKKHKRNLQVQINPPVPLLPGSSHENVQSDPSSIQAQVLIGAVNELESKKLKVLNGGASLDSVKVCTVCNIVCNSQDVYHKHLAGKKHAAQVGLMSNNVIGPHIGPMKKGPKKIKVAQSAWCEVCKINCNSRDVYIVHLAGKKHIKNLEKLSKPKINASASAGTADSLTIGPQEKPGPDEPKSKKTSEMDIEKKKRRVVEGGAAEADVKLCTLCNVVCNSQTVFDAHLAGHRHATMVKKQAISNTG